MIKAKRIKHAFLAFCLLIFLAILGIVFSGPSNGVKNAAEELKQLSANIRKHYQNRPGYWGLNTDAVLSNKIAPDEMYADGKIMSPIGIVLVGSGAEGEIIMPGSRTFDIVFKDLGFKDCVDMVGFRFKEEQYLGLVSIRIVNDKAETLFDWGTENSILESKNRAKKVCSEKSDVIWSYE